MLRYTLVIYLGLSAGLLAGFSVANAEPPPEDLPNAKSGLANGAKAHYRQGVVEFKLQRYQQAKQQFIAARELGLELSRLNFNLGSSYFKLAEYTLAYNEFELSARDPQLVVLSTINLGLCAIYLGESALAEQHLNKAWTMARTEKSRRQIQQLMDKHGMQATVTKGPSSRWNNQLSLMLGYNSNVTLTELLGDNEATHKSDQYAYSVFTSNFNAGSGFSLATGIQSLNYDEIHEYNYASLYAQPAYNWHIGLGQISLAVKLQSAYLAKDWFLTTAALTSHIQYKINKHWYVSADYNFAHHKERDTIYSYLAGTQFNQQYIGQYSIKSTSMGIRLGQESNNREDQAHSPTRWLAGLYLNQRLGPKNYFDCSAFYRQSRYSQQSQTQRRIDDRTGVNVRYTRQLNKSLWTYINYDYIDNASTQYQYRYNSSNTMVGITWRI